MEAYKKCERYEKDCNHLTTKYHITNDKKLDGVGPVDNRPSTNKLQHFVLKKEKEKSDMLHLTCDM